jgi:hypothetical protein
MSRSVTRNPESVGNTYILTDGFEESYDWDDFVQYLREIITNSCTYGTYLWDNTECNGHTLRHGNDIQEILNSGSISVWLSEYNGIVCIGVVDEEGTEENDKFTRSIEENIASALCKAFRDHVLVPQGHASNGEQFFKLSGKPDSCVTSKEGKLW